MLFMAANQEMRTQRVALTVFKDTNLAVGQVSYEKLHQ